MKANVLLNAMEDEEGMVSAASMDSTSVSICSTLFNVMCVVPDRQELSFVEKVQLPQGQILLLCNELVTNSAVATGTQFTQVRIDFNALNQRCIPVVGLYGNKQMMVEVFRKQGLLGEEVVLDQLEPGLYAIVEKSAIFVFYWHEGQDLKEASRKDVSCNFIRYLVELSDYLYVCVQGYYPFEASASSARTAAFKGRRTKKLQISHVKNSENDVTLSDGFSVSIDRQFKKSASAPPVAPSNVVFCDGYNRCAFLTADYRPSSVSKRAEQKSLKAYQLRSQIESWSKDGDLSFCRMSNEHFVSLLKIGYFPRYEEYCNFMKILNNSIAEDRVGVSAESSIEAIHKRVVASFLKILPEYFSGAQLLDEALPGTSSQNHQELRGSHSVDRFDQLHQELSEILAGKDCDKKLIYHGSEVKFTDPVDNGGHFIFRIEGLQKQTGPVRYGREIILKSTNPKREFKATLQQSNKETLLSPFSFSGERVILRMKRQRQGHLEGSLEVVSSSSIAIQRWVKSFIPKKLQCLGRNIGFVALLVAKGETDNQMPSVGMPLIEKILTTENLKSIERDLPDEIVKLFKQFEPTDGASVDRATWVKLLSNKQVRPVILNLYKTSREEFVNNLEFMLRKEFWSAFQKKLESQVTETINLLRQSLHLEEDKFLSAMKREMSVMRDKPVCRFIEAFEVQNSWFRNELNLKVSIEGHEKPSIAWNISELMPKKNDLEELSRNTEHRINPTFTDQFELVALDPEVERILKVVALKSGHLLMFIQNLADPCLCVYSCPRMGSRLDLIKRFRRGYDLLSVDEGTRFLAFYDKETSKVSVHRFGESFRNLDWTGVDVDLRKFAGTGFLTWMHLIPGKRELILIDDTNRVRVVELHMKPMMKPKPLFLPSPVSVALVSVDGSFIFVFHKSSDNHDEAVEGSRDMMEVDEKAIDSSVTVCIYVLADVMSHLRSIPLNKSFRDLVELQTKIVNFGSQSHLVFFSGSAPGNLCSYILKIISANEVVQLQAIQSTENKVAQVPDERRISGCCPPLEYIYHIFDKFATSPALFGEDKKDVFFNVLLNTKEIDQKCNEHACQNVLRSLLQQLEKEKGKDFSYTEIQIDVKRFEPWISGGAVDLTGLATKAMGTWIRRLACLVPIQIARAENNGLLALKDGFEIPPELSYADCLSLTNLITFGIYDTVLRNWEGEIIVISSMGKQSSGKSYLLNHLSGSLLDVAGGRCTDGVWMTARAAEKRIYVVLDFEGLGSFERTEQEDMLLSVLNAAISNLTIFNKKDFHLDKETEVVFDRFQNGISLVKQDKDKRLFKGIFYIAIKDVDSSDVDDLKHEFEEKISRICSKTPENFLSKMYGGKVEIAAMPPYNRLDYQDSLREIASTVEEMNSCYHNGTAFLNDVKLVIAQIAAKDWTSVDSKRVALRVDILRRNLQSAIERGCLSAAGEIQMLVSLDTEEEVSDFPVAVEEFTFDFPDTGLELAPSVEPTAVPGSIVSELRSTFESVVPRKGTDGEWWHSVFERFLGALADRRRKRVEQFLISNTLDFASADEVHKLQLEAAAGIAGMKQMLSVCGCKCSECFWRCVLEKGHVLSHSCMSSHVCSEKCTFCTKEETENSVEECKYLAGHDGPHDCKMKNHTCGEICDLFKKSSNCNKSCSIKLGHEGPHKCNSPQHMCKKKCSLPTCQNPCVVPIEFGDHDRHACHERYCQSPCLMKGCTRTCGYKDHFHDLNRDAEHLCGNEHVCPEKCGVPGICEIFTELVRQTRQFQGRRGSFEYEHVSEQNGLRKDCCVPVPAFKRSHEGPHVHTTNEEAVHYCETRCHSCGYFCQLPIDHPGLHNTVHGNMRNVKFISETEEIDIDERKYAWGETGLAEMCNMHCRKQGRGHIHLVPCPENCTSKLYDGSRHETRKYGPDLDVPKDEMTHETYWKYIRFVDLCTEEEQNEFGLCNHYCRSEEHEDLPDKKAGAAPKSYCTEKLWHASIKRTGLNVSSAGYITDDGHHFGCDHSKNVPHHVIFVIDKSGSMGSTDIKPTMSMFSPSHDCRLGCVFEAIIRFIRTRLRTVSDDSVSVILFDYSSVVALEMKEMREEVVNSLLDYDADGGTTYSSGLELAEKVMIKASKDPTTDHKRPMIVFLSDGGNNGGGDPLYYVDRMKQQEPRMILHTIMFGTDSTINILKEMANIGNGTFQLSLDEVQLARSFEDLATSLKPKVAALM